MFYHRFSLSIIFLPIYQRRFHEFTKYFLCLLSYESSNFSTKHIHIPFLPEYGSNSLSFKYLPRVASSLFHLSVTDFLSLYRISCFKLNATFLKFLLHQHPAFRYQILIFFFFFSCIVNYWELLLLKQQHLLILHINLVLARLPGDSWYLLFVRSPWVA